MADKLEDVEVAELLEYLVDPPDQRGETILSGELDKDITLYHVIRLKNGMRMYWSDGTVTQTITTVVERHNDEGEWRLDNDGTIDWFVYGEEG